MTKTYIIDYCKRFNPDFRYREDKTSNITLNNFVSKDPSKTDKESYRLTLASLSGDMQKLNTMNANLDIGQYSLKPGENYNPDLDFSYLNKPGLTIVELDEFIDLCKRQAEELNITLSKEVELALANKRSELEKEETKDDKGVTK